MFDLTDVDKSHLKSTFIAWSHFLNIDLKLLLQRFPVCHVSFFLCSGNTHLLIHVCIRKGRYSFQIGFFSFSQHRVQQRLKQESSAL